jgi:hypothetical protein
MKNSDGTAIGMARNMELVENPAFVRRPRLRIRPKIEVYGLSMLVGIAVFLFALGLQWVIYDRMLHQDGIRVVGSLIAGSIAAVLVGTMAIRDREKRLAEVRRLETIALMNHHIRNALQVIAYSTGLSKSAEEIRNSVNRIEWALSEVLPHVNDGEEIH